MKNEEASNGDHALQLGAKAGLEDIVKVLVDAGADQL